MRSRRSKRSRPTSRCPNRLAHPTKIGRRVWGLVRLGQAWPGLVRLGQARWALFDQAVAQTWTDLVRLGHAWSGSARLWCFGQALVRLGQAWSGFGQAWLAWPDLVRLGQAWKVWSDLVRLGQALVRLGLVRLWSGFSGLVSLVRLTSGQTRFRPELHQRTRDLSWEWNREYNWSDIRKDKCKPRGKYQTNTTKTLESSQPLSYHMPCAAFTAQHRRFKPSLRHE